MGKVGSISITTLIMYIVIPVYLNSLLYRLDDGGNPGPATGVYCCCVGLICNRGCCVFLLCCFHLQRFIGSAILPALLSDQIMRDVAKRAYSDHSTPTTLVSPLTLASSFQHDGDDLEMSTLVSWCRFIHTTFNPVI